MIKAVTISLLTVVSCASGFSAMATPLIPGVSDKSIAICTESPRLVGDVGRVGKYKASIVEKIREFSSYYEVNIRDRQSNIVVSTLRGSSDKHGNLVLDHSQGSMRPGFNQSFVKSGSVATWTLSREFGSPKLVDFLCEDLKE